MLKNKDNYRLAQANIGFEISGKEIEAKEAFTDFENKVEITEKKDKGYR